VTERDIFIAALQKEDPAERQAYLDEACSGQPELRRQVQHLLRLYEGAGSFLENPAADSPATGAFQEVAEPAAPPEVPGTVIGPYKLLEQIGEGGMGTVWMAQQQQPVKRVVAVKLIKAGMDSKQVIARFEAERQALALMDHANIARVLDAGTTSAGRPYFVMDLVKGVPITKYCDEHRLTPKQRLELFIPVCQAVQHAHQKGIIHRDLKPSNVLVALYDGKPVPKVIDFGVAKAAGQTLTDKTLVTGFGAIVGTLEYMSPEQAEINQLDIDTRSDIYSLGVLLYELLAGSPPFSRKELEKAGMLEMLRVIREQEPSKPSTKLSSSDALPTLSANRGTEPAKLTKLVRGELDWIVMKALEKDRNRRYETANGFAMDVQRYLADEPVQACPPSAAYRLRKFARRNKAALAIAACVLAVVLGLVASAAWFGRQRAFRQAETQRGVTAALAQAETFLQEGEKQMDYPERWQATARLAQSALEKAEELLAAGAGTEELADQVEQVRLVVNAAVRDSRLLVELERIRLEQANFDSRGIWFDRVYAARKYAELLKEYGIDLAAPEDSAARIRASRLQEALLAALGDWLRGAKGEEKQQLWKLYCSLPKSELRLRLDKARGWRDEAAMLKVAEEAALQNLPPASLIILADDASMSVEGTATAERLLRAGLERKPGDFWLNYKLAELLLNQKPARAGEAVPYLTAALALRSDSPGVYLALGDALQMTKDLDGAIRCYQAALRINPDFAFAHNNLGNALREKGDAEGAIRCYRAAIKIDPKNAIAHNNVGAVLIDMGKLDEAIAWYRRAIEFDPTDARFHVNLGAALRAQAKRDAGIVGPGSRNGDQADHLGAQGKLDEVVASYREAIEWDPTNAGAYHGLGEALSEQGKVEDAIDAYRKCVELNPKAGGTYHTLGNLLVGRPGKAEEAIACYRKAVAIDPSSYGTRLMLGIALEKAGRLEEAIAEYREVTKRWPREVAGHHNLGDALRRQGSFAEALSVSRRGHELSLELKLQDWGATLAQLVQQCERQNALDEKLAAILKGDAQPANNQERLELAHLCFEYKKRYVAAVRFYRDAFDAKEQSVNNLEDAGYLWSAACAAVLASCGQGTDANKLDDKEMERLRLQALDWLRADLRAKCERLEKDGNKFGPVLHWKLQNFWLADPKLASVREPEALAKLPDAERQSWQQLWADVNGQRAKVGEPLRVAKVETKVHEKNEIIKGQTVILGTFAWTMDGNKQGNVRTADFEWQKPYLFPRNGAKAVLVPDQPFEKITAEDLGKLKYSTDKISESILRPGAVVAVRTARGNLAKLKVVRYRALHDFDFKEAIRLSREWTAMAVQKPDIKEYHLEVEWVIYHK
jgi:serine/threonine protein kinase/tetratricopeptide (TPR) repeat protein